MTNKADTDKKIEQMFSHVDDGTKKLFKELFTQDDGFYHLLNLVKKEQ